MFISVVCQCSTIASLFGYEYDTEEMVTVAAVEMLHGSAESVREQFARIVGECSTIGQCAYRVREACR